MTVTLKEQTNRLTGTSMCAKVLLQIEVLHHVGEFAIIGVVSKL